MSSVASSRAASALTAAASLAAQPRLSRAQIDAFQAELDALRREVQADLGERDARYIRRVVRVQQGTEAAGRVLLMFGLTPLSWGLGVAALSTAKILENMEIGHNVMHGQYDWMNDPALDGQTYEWDIACTGDNWRHYHNYEHHTYTNVQGLDRDLGYGMIRITADQPWNPLYLAQPLTYAGLAALFQWGVGLHDMDPLKHGRSLKGLRKLATTMRPFFRKARRQLYKDYLFYPAISLWNAPRVFAGNLAANLARNVWTNVVIFCGHFPEGAQTFAVEDLDQESRGDWYLRQIQGSANFEGGKLLHIMTGHLSLQIEHHLFPDLPAHRYAEIAPRVRAICARYGVPYNTGSFMGQYRSVLGKILRYSLPGGVGKPVAAA